MQESLLFPEERSTHALGHAQPSARLQHLSAEHEQLRKKVLRRRRELERFETDLREIGGAVAVRASTLTEEFLRLDAAIHASFADILEKKKLSKRARADICDVYEELKRDGIITPDDAAPASTSDGWPGDCHTEPRDRGAASPRAEPDDAGDQDANANHRGRAAHLRDLRKTFLALADAIHPDKVQDEDEKMARTEAMKELNRAYREGDMARILELERAWNFEGKLDPGAAAGELERRCQLLERQNALLIEQLRELSKTLSSLRRTMPGSIVVEVRRLRRDRDPDPIGIVLAPLEQELDVLRKLASFVQAFQNSEMSLARFLEGPQLPYDGDEFDFEEIMDMVIQGVKKTTRSAGEKHRSRRR